MDMLGSRRFILAMVATAAIWSLGFYKNQEVGLHLATMVIGVAAANAYQKKG